MWRCVSAGAADALVAIRATAAATTATAASEPMTHFLMEPSLWSLAVQIVSSTETLLRASSLRRPADEQALGEDDGAVERETQDRRHDDARPGGGEVEDLRVGLDADAECVECAAEVLADDGSDHREN